MNDLTPGSKAVNVSPADQDSGAISPIKLTQKQHSFTPTKGTLLKTKTMKGRMRRNDSMFAAKRAVLNDIQ